MIARIARRAGDRGPRRRCLGFAEPPRPRSTYEHGEIAANLLAGRGFTTHFLGADGPTSQQAPIYPALVCLAYAIGGVETPQALFLLS